jgi:hypothetical protein
MTAPVEEIVAARPANPVGAQLSRLEKAFAKLN